MFLVPALLVAYLLAPITDHGSAWPLLLGGAVFALVGLADDLRDLSAALRLFLQVAGSAGLVAAVSMSGVGNAIELPWLIAFCLSTFGLVAVINAVNFMDGINGITSVTAAITLGLYALLAENLLGFTTTTFALAGLAVSAIVFLPFNFPNAQAFLGDSGSYLFGATIGIGALVLVRLDVSLLTLISPLLFYSADTFTTLIRRTLKGEIPWAPHRSHVYQRLTNELDLGHARVTLFVGFLSLISVSFALWFERGSTISPLVVGSAYALLIVAYLLSPSFVSVVKTSDR